MDEHTHHQELIDGIYRQLKEIFENSDQGVYVYLDDTHNVSNGKFAQMLGYDSAAQLTAVEETFLNKFVETDSQETLVSAFQGAMEKMRGSTNMIVWKRKDGETIDTTVILVPIIYENHLMALHFIQEI
jgi:PAS domain S-box-containing protein